MKEVALNLGVNLNNIEEDTLCTPSQPSILHESDVVHYFVNTLDEEQIDATKLEEADIRAENCDNFLRKTEDKVPFLEFLKLPMERGEDSSRDSCNSVVLPDQATMVDTSHEGAELLLHGGIVEDGNPTSEETAWRLKFNRVPRPERDEKRPRRIHDCFNVVLGPGDGVAEYYQQQEEMLEGFTEMDTVSERGFLPGMSKEEREKVARSERIAIRLSNLANVVLFAAKIFASIKSGSLAIIASTLDSLLDLLSGFILWFTAFKMRKPNPYIYPIGKKRMQPLGILVFASVMATLGLQIILESVRQLISKEEGLSLEGDKWHWVVGIMVSVTLVKLALVIYCQTFTNEIVKAFAQDHFFDVITNSIGLFAAVLASTFYWWIDPFGAIV
ncbi:hypothetical protein KI387_027901, partial [Taxus chinensis]